MMSEAESILESYRSHLSQSGCIRDLSHVTWLINQMRSATKLVDKYMLLHILKLTCLYRGDDSEEKKEDAVERFIKAGGWTLLNTWLMEFMNNKNYAFTSIILKILAIIPVNLELLKQGNIGKLVKKASKIDYQSISDDSKSLIQTWKSLIVNPPDESAHVSEDETNENTHLKESSRNAKTSNEGKKEKQPSSRILLIDPLPQDELKKSQTRISHTSTPNIKSQTFTSVLDEIIDSKFTEKSISRAISSSSIVSGKSAESSLNSTLEEDPIEPKRKKSLKRVKWKPDDNLKEVFVFETNEEEIKQPHDHGDFSEARHHELVQEALAIKMAKSQKFDDRLISKPWTKPPSLEIDGELPFKFGNMSLEKDIQLKRESETVAVLYFKPEQIPFTPTEITISDISTTDSSAQLDQEEESTHESPSRNQSSLSENPVTISADHNGELFCPEWPSEYWIKYVMERHNQNEFRVGDMRTRHSPPYGPTSFYERDWKEITPSYAGPSSELHGSRLPPSGGPSFRPHGPPPPPPHGAFSRFDDYRPRRRGHPDQKYRMPHRRSNMDEERQPFHPRFMHQNDAPRRIRHQENYSGPPLEPRNYADDGDMLMPPDEFYHEPPQNEFLSRERDAFHSPHHSSFGDSRPPFDHSRGQPRPYHSRRPDSRMNFSSHRIVCKHFMGRGCRNGDNCRFFHPPPP